MTAIKRISPPSFDFLAKKFYKKQMVHEKWEVSFRTKYNDSDAYGPNFNTTILAYNQIQAENMARIDFAIRNKKGNFGYHIFSLAYVGILK